MKKVLPPVTILVSALNHSLAVLAIAKNAKDGPLDIMYPSSTSWQTLIKTGASKSEPVNR